MPFYHSRIYCQARLDKFLKVCYNDIISITKVKGKTFKKMNDKQIEMLQDLMAYVSWGIEHELSFDTILFNAAHDIDGMASRDKFFSPRTKGYTKVVKAEIKTKIV